MTTTTVSGLRIDGVRRLRSSVNGHPRYDVAFTDRAGVPHTYMTQSDAPVGHDVRNNQVYSDRDPSLRFTVELSRGNRIVNMTPEAGAELVPDYGPAKPGS